VVRHDRCGILEHCLDRETRAVGVQLDEHVPECGQTEHGFFHRRRTAVCGHLGQALCGSKLRIPVPGPSPGLDEAEGELPASVLALVPGGEGLPPGALRLLARPIPVHNPVKPPASTTSTAT
jgi:hypothetical protein